MINASIRLTSSAVVLVDTSAGVTDRLIWPLLKGVKLALPTPLSQKKGWSNSAVGRGKRNDDWHLERTEWTMWMNGTGRDWRANQPRSKQGGWHWEDRGRTYGGGGRLSSSTYTHRVTLQQCEGKSKFIQIISFNNNVMSLLTCL